MLALPTLAFADPSPAGAGGSLATPPFKPDTGDTAWMLISTALVLLMTIPGLALFYGGLVRSKNILSTFMHSLFCAIIVSVLWVVVGYSIAFGTSTPALNDWIGGFGWSMLKDLPPSHPLAPTIPHLLFCAYQLTFAIITPALISGAFAERIRFPGFVLLMVLWSLFIYAPLAHWVWGGGWIGTKLGALDFAGGTVVHISSGVSALVCAIYVGKRHGYGVEPMTPHNLPFTVMGAGLLWVGWFGFNAGSALGAGELASTALINTHTAAAAAGAVWMLVEFLRARHPTILGAASGAVAGLVAITPAAGFVTPVSALIIGGTAGLICYFAVSFKPKLGYDDALDVVGVHFVGGTLGAILTGVFATSAVNSTIPTLTAGGDAKAPTTLFGSVSGGLIEGHGSLVLTQLLAVIATVAFAGLGTWLLLVIVNAISPLRAKANEEVLGMDLSQHRERAYTLGGAGEAMGAAAAVMADPRAATMPPSTAGSFIIVVEGLDSAALADKWRLLAGAPIDGGTQMLRDVYNHLSVIRGTKLRFHSGQPEIVRQAVESLFKAIAPQVRARIDS